MQDNLSRYAVGLDVGTTKVRAVVGHLEEGATVPTIIGAGEAPNSGMRKGVVVNMVQTAEAIDKALEGAERMSGYQVNAATVSINGSHIVGMTSKGVVAVGTGTHEISEEDLDRAEEAATVVQLPANREILQVTPRSYKLDDQDNIKDPVGMTGVRLEVDAHVITALAPHVKNLQKSCEMTQTVPRGTVLAGLGAAHSALTDQQKENGVVLIDLGGTTTNLAVFEEGDLQHIAVLPMGSVHITNDLAIGLKTDLDVADTVKLEHATLGGRSKSQSLITVNVGKEKHGFDPDEVDMIVEARTEELFELINQELKSIGRAAKLPGGAVLTGGGANLKGVAQYAKEALQLPARTAKAPELKGMLDKVEDTAYATAVGLMLIDLIGLGTAATKDTGSKNMFNGFQGLGGKFGGILKKFRP
jgi:cell division protein FtsA